METEVREWTEQRSTSVFWLDFQRIETAASYFAIHLTLNDNEAACESAFVSTCGLVTFHENAQEFVCHNENLDSWQSAVGSTLDSTRPHTLGGVLDALREAFRSMGGAVSEDEEEFDYDSDNDPMGGGDDARQEWLQEHDLFERLRRKEASMRESATTTVLPASARRVRNIFLSSEAGQVLLEEFREVRRAGPAHGILADAVHDDIYHWRVQLRDFPSSSDMAKGLRELTENTTIGVDFVELDVLFARGLYPFYPPRISLVRPRLSGSVPWRLMSLPELRLEHWKPIREGGMLETLTMVKDFLGEIGEVDVSFANRVESTDYSELERIVLQLGMSTETPPRASSVGLAAGPDGHPAKRACVDPGVTTGTPARRRSSPKRGFAEGTGYSGGSDAGWDPRKFRAAQLEKDRQLLRGIRQVIAYLEPAVQDPGGDGCDPAAAEDRHHSPLSDRESARLNDFIEASDAEGVRLQLAADAEEQDEAERSLTEPEHRRYEVAAGCYDMLASASLLPLLAVHLSNESLVDMERHRQLNRALLRLVRAIAGIDELAPLLLLPVEAHGSFASVATRLGERARQAEVVQRAVAGAEGDDASSGVPYSLTEDTITTTCYLHDRTRKLDLSEARPVRDPLHLSRGAAARRGADAAAAGAGGGGAGGASTEGAAGDSVWSERDEAAYCDALGPLRYRTVRSLSHFSLRNVPSSAMRNRRRMRRIGTEHADLARALPVAGSSSAFVRSPESRLDQLRVIIVGPEGTPYSGGMFLFEFLLGEDYPNKPPEVQLLTTGSGTVRFNPNLYASGKVCLSLLGTWRGSAGEGWDANTSTLNQVILSIQSLILVEEPYFNEPGYQSQINTPEGDAQSLRYNQHCRLNTILLAMVDMLTHPPSEFEDVIRLHFRLRKNFILKQVDHWCEKSESGGKHADMLRARERLREELDKLE